MNIKTILENKGILIDKHSYRKLLNQKVLRLINDASLKNELSKRNTIESDVDYFEKL